MLCPTQASQEYNPADRTVINRGEVLGSRLYVTAAGTYEPEVPARRLLGKPLYTARCVERSTTRMHACRAGPNPGCSGPGEGVCRGGHTSRFWPGHPAAHPRQWICQHCISGRDTPGASEQDWSCDSAGPRIQFAATCPTLRREQQQRCQVFVDTNRSAAPW